LHNHDMNVCGTVETKSFAFPTSQPDGDE